MAGTFPAVSCRTVYGGGQEGSWVQAGTQTETGRQESCLRGASQCVSGGGLESSSAGGGGGAGTQAARRLAERLTHPPNLLPQHQVLVVQRPLVLGERGARGEGSEVSETGMLCPGKDHASPTKASSFISWRLSLLVCKMGVGLHSDDFRDQAGSCWVSASLWNGSGLGIPNLGGSCPLGE